MSMMGFVAWIASGLVFMTFFVRNPIRMRAFAVAANLAFIAYGLFGLNDGLFERVAPIFVLHLSSLILNIVRLREELEKTGSFVFLRRFVMIRKVFRSLVRA